MKSHTYIRYRRYDIDFIYLPNHPSAHPFQSTVAQTHQSGNILCQISTKSARKYRNVVKKISYALSKSVTVTRRIFMKLIPVRQLSSYTELHENPTATSVAGNMSQSDSWLGALFTFLSKESLRICSLCPHSIVRVSCVRLSK